MPNAPLQATPLLSILRDLVLRRARIQAAGETVPSSVHFVWTCRHAQEFTLLDESLVQAARYVLVSVTLSHVLDPCDCSALRDYIC